MTFEAAAALPHAGVLALQSVRHLRERGQKVLINGAGEFAPVIDRSFRLEETADALASIGAGVLRGKAVVKT